VGGKLINLDRSLDVRSLAHGQSVLSGLCVCGISSQCLLAKVSYVATND